MIPDGKLIFTKVNSKRCVVLMQNNELIAASFQGEKEKITGGIFVARVRDVVKNLNACFAEIKQGMICFLPDLSAQTPFFLSGFEEESTADRIVKQGDLILVQGIREAQKTKQPAVTTKISLSNHFFVVTIGNTRTSFSSKLPTARKNELKKELCTEPFFDEKGNLKSWTWLDQEKYPYRDHFPAIGVIFRTACMEVPLSVLKSQLAELLGQFAELLNSACYRSAYTCLLMPPSPWEDAINHFVMPDEYSEIVTDDPELYEEMNSSELIPEGTTVRFYEDRLYPLEKLYSLSTKLESALCKRVWLKSGAYLIIEPTEALTVIDVNSGKYEAKRGVHFYTSINLEAAAEIAIQIRLRNLSGMILVDFINMTEPEDQALLIQEMQRLLQKDRVRTCVVDFTRLGLMEITRQKTVPPLMEQALKYHYPIPKNERGSY